MTKYEIIIGFLQHLIDLGADKQPKDGWKLGDLIKQAEIYTDKDDGKMVDADGIIKKLNNRIDSYITNYPNKKNSLEVESVKQLVEVIEREVER